MHHAIIYAAKSTEDKHGSIPTQLEDCRAKAKREGWTIEGPLPSKDYYSDEGFSAYKGNRGPDLAQAREHVASLAERNGGAVLLVQHSDRLARGAGDTPGAAEHLAEIVFWARRHNVELRSVQDDDALRNPLLAFVMGERNMEDSRRKAAAVKAGMVRRAARGLFNGRKPYGYALQRDEDKTLAPVPHEAAAVQRIFREYEAGRSQLSIARGLGKPWHQGQVRKVLANPVYKGVVRYGGQEYAGKHQPIIEPELWDRVAELRAINERSNGKGRGRKPLGIHLLIRGHLKCGQCGGSMGPVTRPAHAASRHKTTYEAYGCLTRIKSGPDACSQGPVSRESIDGAIRRYFASGVLPFDWDDIRDRITTGLDGQLAEARSMLDQAESEGHAADTSLTRIKCDYKAGKLTAEEWRELKNELEQESKGAQAKADQLRAHLREVETAQRVGGTLEARLTEIREAIGVGTEDHGQLDRIRAALRRTFDSFTLYGGEARREPSDALLRWEDGNHEYELQPQIRSEAIAGWHEGIVPTFKPVRL